MKKQKDFEKMPVVNARVAGVDVGSTSHFVAIGQSKEDVKEYGCYTDEAHELCGWLKSQGNEKAAHWKVRGAIGSSCSSCCRLPN